MATEQGDGDGDDPFEGLTLDDDFVASAEVREHSAEDRLARLQRIDREHRALQDERERERKQAATTRQRRWQGRRSARGTSMPSSGRGNTWRVVICLVVLIGLFVWVTFLRDGGTGSSVRPTGLASAASTLVGVFDDSPATVRYAGGQPPPGVEESDTPLGQPGPHPTGTGPFVFKELQADGVTAIAWDPCRPIHYVVNTRTAPADGGQLLTEAIARISAATGLQFILDGPSDEDPIVGTEEDHAFREYYQPDRYGDRWAPVLVAWSDPAETAELDGMVAGVGGGQPVSPSTGLVYVTGGITLDGPQLTELELSTRGQAEVRATIEHELGHLVGLGHVDDPTQLMNPSASEVDDFADGDLEGLALLGQGACFPGV